MDDLSKAVTGHQVANAVRQLQVLVPDYEPSKEIRAALEERPIGLSPVSQN